MYLPLQNFHGLSYMSAVLALFTLDFAGFWLKEGRQTLVDRSLGQLFALLLFASHNIN